ncbi:MAG TPA: zf-HC2 domain-containing protein [Blastocatellia bacterium]|nr:zf-HC2 domain-containing protein [Blastocatellia bacterium]
MISCKQVEKLLPLYVSSDLEAGRVRLVIAHLESCIACSDAAGEYRQTRQLIQEFAPPAFSEDVYAGIRQNVWRQIESESSTGSRWESITGWFRPRLTWAALAAVALIAVSAFGIYLIANRQGVPQPIAGIAPSTNPNSKNREARRPESQKEGALAPALTSKEGPRLADRRSTQRRTRPEPIPEATTVAHAPHMPSLTGDNSSGVTSAQSDAGADKNSENTLRMEIQTRNPNIRIIWFSQRDRKRMSPNSKGI